MLTPLKSRGAAQVSAYAKPDGLSRRALEQEQIGRLKCPLCESWFDSEGELFEHMNTRLIMWSADHSGRSAEYVTSLGLAEILVGLPTWPECSANERAHA